MKKKSIIISFWLLSILVYVFFIIKSQVQDNPSEIRSLSTRADDEIKPNPVSLLDSYKKDRSGFDIAKYEKDTFKREIYADCNDYVMKKSEDGFESAKYFTKATESDIGFNEKIDCKSEKNDYCSFLGKYDSSRAITLNEAKYGLYALFAKDLSYGDFKSIFSDVKKLKLANMGPDIKYIELYSDMIIGKISNTEDCIDFVSRKGNSLLDNDD